MTLQLPWHLHLVYIADPLSLVGRVDYIFYSAYSSTRHGGNPRVLRLAERYRMEISLAIRIPVQKLL